MRSGRSKGTKKPRQTGLNNLPQVELEVSDKAVDDLFGAGMTTIFEGIEESEDLSSDSESEEKLCIAI